MNHIRQIRPRILQRYTSAIVATLSLMIIALLPETNTSALAQVQQSSKPVDNSSESQTERDAMTSTPTSDEHIPGTLYLDGPGEILFEESSPMAGHYIVSKKQSF